LLGSPFPLDHLLGKKQGSSTDLANAPYAICSWSRVMAGSCNFRPKACRLGFSEVVRSAHQTAHDLG